ncbi:MAG: hypothetical protein H7A25_06285 [Leptospiraceae bacterium]|nr:hypothetical protein [Leptospiraceae bacterium]MCP5499492.1 hypothetical protein [Leptospiraceae bacterium]
MDIFTLILFVWSITLAVYFIVVGSVGLITEKFDSKNRKIAVLEERIRNLEVNLKNK